MNCANKLKSIIIIIIETALLRAELISRRSLFISVSVNSFLRIFYFARARPANKPSSDLERLYHRISRPRHRAFRFNYIRRIIMYSDKGAQLQPLLSKWPESLLWQCFCSGEQRIYCKLQQIPGRSQHTQQQNIRKTYIVGIC